MADREITQGVLAVGGGTNGRRFVAGGPFRDGGKWNCAAALERIIG